LLYVGMTRAKDSLHLITPQRFFVTGQAARGDRHIYASRTRFIPANILSHFEQTAWPPASAGTSDIRSPRGKIDLGAKMRGMWK
jgi:DNA helicase-2/ATP-dependent DNA helicase PcrA